jgi:peptide-methionine (S)-S-oxide reductase
MIMRLFLFSLLFIGLYACAQSPAEVEHIEKKTLTSEDLDGLQVAYFGSGCFWCVEAIFESVKGVEEVVSGYAGGKEVNPTYEEVSAGRTGHAESVKIYYDSTVVSYETLVDVFFASHDPTTLNQQGPDKGTQYRSIAFYSNDHEKEIIESKILTLLTEKVYSKITTEVVPFEAFYEAEDYHQDYERLHPNNPYVRGVSIPRLNAFKKKMPQVLK